MAQITSALLRIEGQLVHSSSQTIYLGTSTSLQPGEALNDLESFRSSDPVTRKRYVKVVEAVQQKGGEVVIFSSMHESGQRELTNPLNFDRILTVR